MANPWADFERLLAPAPRLIADVISHDAGGSSVVQLLGGGGLLRVEGISVPVGQRCYVQDGRMVGPAPDLPVTVIDV